MCIVKTEYIALAYFYLKMELWRVCCLCMGKGETRHKLGETLRYELDNSNLMPEIGNHGLKVFVG